MEKLKRRPRWSYMLVFLIVLVTQLIILWINKWSFYYTYSYNCNSFGIVTVVWLHLLWGVHNLIGFINYNKVDKPNEEEEDEYYE